jgi:hypothetical protein
MRRPSLAQIPHCVCAFREILTINNHYLLMQRSPIGSANENTVFYVMKDLSYLYEIWSTFNTFDALFTLRTKREWTICINLLGPSACFMCQITQHIWIKFGTWCLFQNPRKFLILVLICAVHPRPDWRASQPGSCTGHQPVNGAKTSLDNRQYGASKLRFSHEKEILWELFTIWARDLEIFRQRCIRLKKFKEFQV